MKSFFSRAENHVHSRHAPVSERGVLVGRQILRCLLGVLLAWPSICAADSKTAKYIPVPPPRPAELALPAPPIAPEPGANAGCGGATADSGFSGEIQPPLIASDGCGIASPVLLKWIVLRTGAKVAVAPPALVSCTLAAALAQWLRDDVGPAMHDGNAQLTRIETAGAYDCRGRNRIKDARMSEHATGNALDISAFTTDHAQRFEIARQGAASAFFQSLKQTACARFMTVLGPGSDGYHETHLHVDLQSRSYGTHICQWKID